MTSVKVFVFEQRQKRIISNYNFCVGDSVLITTSQERGTVTAITLDKNNRKIVHIKISAKGKNEKVYIYSWEECYTKLIVLDREVHLL